MSTSVDLTQTIVEVLKIGQVVYVHGKVTTLKAISAYGTLEIASGFPKPITSFGSYHSNPIAQDGDYASCFLAIYASNGIFHLCARHKAISAGAKFYFQFCYVTN